MKRALLIAAAIAFALSAGAQKKVMKEAKSLLSDKEYLKAYEKIEIAKDNDESKILPETWIVRGKILTAIGNDTMINKSYPTAFKDAFDSYQKAIEVNPKSKGDVQDFMQELSNACRNIGGEAFNNGKYNVAYDAFTIKIKADDNREKPVIDSAFYYFTGASAMNIQKFDEATYYFNRAISIKFKTNNMYMFLKEAYKKKNDTINELATLKKAFNEFPGDKQILDEYINFYLLTDKPHEALNLLKIAKEKEPKNFRYWFAEGTLYEKLKDIEKAEASFLKAAELDPGYDSYYYLGAMFFNIGVAVNNDATQENDTKKYTELLKQRDIQFNKAIPYLEKAHAINTKDEDVAKSLKSLYMFLQLTDKGNALKAEMGW
jgi:tetratricopeptide (TPR) repeat protein